MIKFLKLTALLFAGVAGLLLIAGIVGKIQSTLPIAALFTDANGNRCQRLCMIGVIAGSTPVSDVLPLFARHPLSHALAVKDIGTTDQARDSNGNEFIASYVTYGPVPFVTQMSWLASAGSPIYHAADALQMFGQPDCVQVSDTSYEFVYSALKLYILISPLEQANLTPNDPIRLIIIYDQNPNLGCVKPYTEDWHGFGAANRYAITDLWSPQRSNKANGKQ